MGSARVALVLVGLGLLVMAVGSSISAFEGVGGAYDEGTAEGTSRLLGAIGEVTVGLAALAMLVGGFGLGRRLGWNGLRVAGGLLGLTFLLVGFSGFASGIGIDDGWLAAAVLLFLLPLGAICLAASFTASPSTGRQIAGSLAVAAAVILLAFSAFSDSGNLVSTGSGGTAQVVFETNEPLAPLNFFQLSPLVMMLEMPLIGLAGLAAGIGLLLVLGPPRTHRAGIAANAVAGLAVSITLFLFSVGAMGAEVWILTAIFEDSLMDAALVTSVVGLFIAGAGGLVGSVSAVACLSQVFASAPTGKLPMRGLSTAEQGPQTVERATFAPPLDR